MQERFSSNLFARPAPSLDLAHGCDLAEVLRPAFGGRLTTLPPHLGRGIGKGLRKAFRTPEGIGEDLAGCFNGRRGNGLTERIADRGDFGLMLLGDVHAFRLRRGRNQKQAAC